MRAIKIIEASIQSHIDWIKYFEKYPDQEKACKLVGDTAFHQERVGEYEEAIESIQQLTEALKEERLCELCIHYPESKSENMWEKYCKVCSEDTNNWKWKGK